MNYYSKVWLSLFILFTIGVSPIFSKVTTKIMNVNTLNKENVKYLTKFSYKIGMGIWQVRAKFDKSISLLLSDKDFIETKALAYMDTDWPAYKSKESCEERASLAKLVLDVKIPINGQWSTIYSDNPYQNDKTQVWYFVISDCNHELSKIDNKGYRLHIEFTMKNSDDSHFSEEENGMILWYFFELIILFGFFFSNSVRFIRFYKVQETWDIPFLILISAIFFEAISIVFELIHMILYSNNGKGLFVFDVFSQTFGFISQFIITLLVILIANGWSIDSYKIQEPGLYIPLVIITIVIHVIMICLGRINDDDPLKFHEYESIPGHLIMILKVMFFCGFEYSIIKNYKKSANVVNKQDFLKRFGFWGGVYLIVPPVFSYLTSIFIAPYLRNKAIVFGTLTSQIGASIILTYIISFKKSKYHQISIKGRTVLPSGKIE